MAGELLTAPDTDTAHTPRYKRLTRSDLEILRTMHKAGKSQVSIAETLGCTQGTVSKWLTSLTDSTELAKEYLRGEALTMARNIVTNGRAADHVSALKGLSVLQDEHSSAIVNVLIGMPGLPAPVPQLPDLVGTFAPQIPEGERKGAETLTIQAGSDKLSYDNEI